MEIHYLKIFFSLFLFGITYSQMFACVMEKLNIDKVTPRSLRTLHLGNFVRSRRGKDKQTSKNSNLTVRDFIVSQVKNKSAKLDLIFCSVAQQEAQKILTSKEREKLNTRSFQIKLSVLCSQPSS